MQLHEEIFFFISVPINQHNNSQKISETHECDTNRCEVTFSCYPLEQHRKIYYSFKKIDETSMIFPDPLARLIELPQ